MLQWLRAGVGGIPQRPPSSLTEDGSTALPGAAANSRHMKSMTRLCCTSRNDVLAGAGGCALARWSESRLLNTGHREALRGGEDRLLSHTHCSPLSSGITCVKDMYHKLLPCVVQGQAANWAPLTPPEVPPFVSLSGRQVHPILALNHQVHVQFLLMAVTVRDRGHDSQHALLS